jgi:uncharacterized protein GlcG (DUF336 family)
LNPRHLAAITVFALASGAAQVQSIPPPAPPPAALPVLLAVKAAGAALTACVAGGWTATVTVTDREGVPRVILLSDGTGALSIITSRRKAYTSAALGVSTAQLAKNLAASGIDPATIDAELIAFPGGLPIVRRGVVIGAIAVGGADRDTTDGNEGCAQAGLDSIKNELN